ncbi:MAG TPA: arginine deiminase-related protein [Sphingomicrobium sp.]|jgi:hypothetical protein
MSGSSCISGGMGEEEQTSGTVLMVRPAAFGFHAEAARSNAFARPAEVDAGAALREFEGLAEGLDRAGIEVLVLEDKPGPAKPDAVFPNNWVSFHGDGTMVLYPMATDARRLERDVPGVRALLEASGFAIRRTVDLSGMEADGRFLEGTGSLILDRPRRRAFANVSARTDPLAVAGFDEQLGFSTFLFDARDRSGQPIYHTNVLLSLGTEFAVLCTDVVPEDQRARLKAALQEDRMLIEVDHEQMRQFACNIIQLKGRGGPVLAMSSAARRSYRPEQRRMLERFGELGDADIPTIEQIGGGSVRCMIADVHLPRR